jgi:mono/diheme cytochrome c family protein
MKSSLVLLLSLVCGLVQTIHAQSADISKGEYIARLGNCVACHTIPDGKPFAGGLKMEVPYLGAIYATNITPDPETGIGNYSFEDFDNAMRKGYSPDHYLYPAMPYPSYAKMSERDMQALYDYFMNEVEPVRQANLPNEIPGWLSPRWPLAVWNFIFVDDDPYEEKSDQSAAWNRGAYLVQGLGHCGACHTPRGWAMQESALDESGDEFLSGAELDHWYATSINGDINSGLGRWSEDDIVESLKYGHNQFGNVTGTMVEVVNNSTHHMTDEDLNAIAEYLKSLPAVAEQGQTPYAYNDATTQTLRALDYSVSGALTYSQSCAACHQLDGNGQSPYHPPLAGNPVIMDPDPSSLINITLNGSLRVITDDIPNRYDMVFFRDLLSDQQIAEVLTYIRSGWGNNAAAVTVEDVAAMRDATDPTRHDIMVLKMK